MLAALVLPPGEFLRVYANGTDRETGGIQTDALRFLLHCMIVTRLVVFVRTRTLWCVFSGDTSCSSTTSSNNNNNNNNVSALI